MTFTKAEYPQRSCRQIVQGEHQDWPCQVREGHTDIEGGGPCATDYVPASAQTREAFEVANPDWQSRMRPTSPFVEDR